MTLTTPQDTVFVLAAWVLRVNAAVHWSLSDKAAGVVCMVPYGFHSTQASPFQWAVVELMWDTLRQSRPLGFGLSAVRCDALLWNSQAQAALKVFHTSLTIPSSFSQTSRWVETRLKSIEDWLEDILFLTAFYYCLIIFFSINSLLAIAQHQTALKNIFPSTKYLCLFKRTPSDCWANTPVEDIWRMLFEFYWLRSCCLSPFTSQWAQRWPLCCLGAPYIIGPNTIKCTFSIWGSKQWQPLRCPRAWGGPTPVTSSTWTMTLIYKQVTSATTAFTQGQLRSPYTKQL